MTTENTETPSKRLIQPVENTLNVALIVRILVQLYSMSCQVFLERLLGYKIDSGATSYMLDNQYLFLEYKSLKPPLKVTLCQCNRMWSCDGE